MNDDRPISKADLQAFEERFAAKVDRCNEQLDNVWQLMAPLNTLTKQIIFALVFIWIAFLTAFFCLF